MQKCILDFIARIKDKIRAFEFRYNIYMQALINFNNNNNNKRSTLKWVKTSSPKNKQALKVS